MGGAVHHRMRATADRHDLTTQPPTRARPENTSGRAGQHGRYDTPPTRTPDHKTQTTPSESLARGSGLSPGWRAGPMVCGTNELRMLGLFQRLLDVASVSTRRVTGGAKRHAAEVTHVRDTKRLA